MCLSNIHPLTNSMKTDQTLIGGNRDRQIDSPSVTVQMSGETGI